MNTKLHMIGNAHIDPVWLWQWHEGFHEVKATFRSALDRMREYDDFVFTASSAAFYEWVEQSDPAMFAEIKQRVAEGRWAIVGGWWVEPDCNIPSGESFVRHGLYSQRYFREKFGVTATVGFNIDSFGHAATLPQILARSGIRYYCFLRPGPHEKELPGRIFWWEAADGSRVLAFQIPFSYESPGGDPSTGSGRDLEPKIRRCAGEMTPSPAGDLRPLDEFMCFYGVGNHGGGPTVANIECIHRLDGASDLPRLVLSRPEAFFRSVEAKGIVLPVVRDELQHHASGCYAAHSGIKRWNRLAENRLLAAEKWSVVAARTTGQPYPADTFASLSTSFGRAWKSVLFNQFHDVMAGTAIEPAYDDSRDQLGEALAIADRGLNLAVQSFAWNIRIPAEPGSRPIVVFNPHTWASWQVVELEFGRFADSDILLDDGGRQVPVQRVQSHATADGRNRLCFVADLPALGYRTYRVVSQGANRPNPPAPPSLAGKGGGAPPPSLFSQGREEPVLSLRAEAPSTGSELALNAVKGQALKAEGLPKESQEDERGSTVPRVAATDTMLDNGRFRLEFDATTGCIKSLRDLRAGIEVFSGLAARAVVIDDPSDTWSHNVFKFDQVCGEFTATSVRPVEAGPVRWTIRVISKYGNSKLVQDFAMYAQLPEHHGDYVDRIEVAVTVDWREQLKMLKLRFPLNLKFAKVTAEIPYGHIERGADGTEEPMQAWVDVSGTSRDAEIAYGFSLLNDGKYSADVNGCDVGLTVLRSPAYANHSPAILEPDGFYSFIDQGIQRFRYALLPHVGSWETAGTVKRAAELNSRPITLIATYHPDGTLPQSNAFIAVEPEDVVVTVIKQAEVSTERSERACTERSERDGEDLILRAYETTGAAARATIRLPKWGRVIEADFGPAEIKTFRVPRDASRPVVETNLLEWTE